MDEKEKEALQDRFSGYQLPKVQLDAGFDYYYMYPHPYYYNQPLDWTKPASGGGAVTGTAALLEPGILIEADYPIQEPGYEEGASSDQAQQEGGSCTMIKMLPIM